MEVQKKDLILIVDDTPKNIQVLWNILHDKGYNVCVATSGVQALEILKTESPSLILLDIQMPDLNGFDTCKKLKADDRTKDIPIIFLTALNDRDKIVEGFEIGAVDYITKPFNVAELSARVATHIEIKKSREKLIELNTSKDKFFSIIAHELRNPLSAILLSSDLLQRIKEKEEPEKILRLGNSINTSVQLISKLLENLIDWARIQTGNLTPRIEPTNIKVIANEVFQLSNNIAKNKQIILNNNITTDTMVKCDTEMTKTILRNLISNSLKFTNKGGMVSIDCAIKEKFLEVTVSDDGVGMSPEKIPFLFSIAKNVSTLGTGNEKGTGLGLILCKELAEKQYGQIKVESKIGKGSKFTFTLPLAQSRN